MTSFTIRKAVSADVARLGELIERSVRVLQKTDYTPAQIDGALESVFGVDTRLIADGTYFIVEAMPDREVVGCGGWSKRKTLFGGDQYSGREDAVLDARQDAAKIRAFFVHPNWARRGIGSLILKTCEEAAQGEGFRRFEMGATLTGVALYRSAGYVEREHLAVPLANGASLPIVRMTKTII
jgi:GNAT superfamily N-acetyltransferase